jgi:uncharacterized protein YwgA
MAKPTEVARLVEDAGGTVVGKTRLQKIAYLLEITGLGAGYQFSYHYYGPYSSDLDSDANIAWAFDLVHREDRNSNWGGSYSVFSTDTSFAADNARRQVAQMAVNVDAVVLELAATAAFLSSTHTNPWAETSNRKPDKATAERISKAKSFLMDLKKINTPRPMPNIA